MPTNMQRVCWLVYLIASALLLYAMFRPEPPVQLYQHSDKHGHFVSFFIVALSGRLAWWGWVREWPYWLAKVVLAVGLEGLQGVLLVHRELSPGDALANLVGVAVALLAWQAWRWQWRRRAARQALRD